MNDSVAARRDADESQMSCCWIKDVLVRIKKSTSNEEVQKSAQIIEKAMNNGKLERYVISVNNQGEARLIGI